MSSNKDTFENDINLKFEIYYKGKKYSSEHIIPGILFENSYDKYNIYINEARYVLEKLSRMFLMDVIDERLHTSYGLQLNDEE